MRVGNVVGHLQKEITVDAVTQTKPKEFDGKYFNINPEATPESRQSLLELLEEFWDIFAFTNDELGSTKTVELSIETGDAKPIRQRLWTRYSTKENEFISEQVKEMLRCGVITRTYSPWACNVVLAPKADGTLRFACDYRTLNKVTEFKSYPLPRIDDVINSLSGSSIFSPLDMISGYWQVRMYETDGSHLKTAFITRDGCFVFRRMPFGLKCATQVFQALMDQLFADMRTKVANYMDDLTPHSADIPTHLETLRKFLRDCALRVLNSKFLNANFYSRKLNTLGLS